ncbi:MAG: hypothetical protein ACO3P1_12745 [Pseudomonadales bacterium]
MALQNQPDIWGGSLQQAAQDMLDVDAKVCLLDAKLSGLGHSPLALWVELSHQGSDVDFHRSRRTAAIKVEEYRLGTQGRHPNPCRESSMPVAPTTMS